MGTGHDNSCLVSIQSKLVEFHIDTGAEVCEKGGQCPPPPPPNFEPSDVINELDLPFFMTATQKCRGSKYVCLLPLFLL